MPVCEPGCLTRCSSRMLGQPEIRWQLRSPPAQHHRAHPRQCLQPAASTCPEAQGAVQPGWHARGRSVPGTPPGRRHARLTGPRRPLPGRQKQGRCHPSQAGCLLGTSMCHYIWTRRAQATACPADLVCCWLHNIISRHAHREHVHLLWPHARRWCCQT